MENDGPGQQIDEVLICGRVAEADATSSAKTGAEGQFRDLLNAAPIMVWISTDAMCTFFNRAWRSFGARMHEEMGNGWTEGLYPDDRDLYVETYLKAFTARQPFRVQYRLRKLAATMPAEQTGTP